MPTPARPLSAAELSALEHAFAADPVSEAYRPLTEAYLAMGRYMEAMVVCKKGVKAHPDDPSARVLLARVYADQGKDRKALDELQAILAAYPTFAAANRMAGVLHMRIGEREQGEAALRRAADAAPDDPEVRAALAKYGVGPAPKATPPAITGETRITEDAPIPTPVPGKNVAYSEELAEKYATREFTLSTPAGKRGKRPGKGHKLLFTIGLAAVLVAA